MASKKRWKQAQEYERSFWHSASDKAGSDSAVDFSWYGWRANNVLNLIKKAIPDATPAFTDAKVLEVGSGPVGTVSFFDAAERYALDPLSDFYSTQPALIKQRNPDVQYRTAQGESLQFDNAYFDLVIIENVIDHVENPDKVMMEINRVLKPGAILFLTVNLHPFYGFILHEIVSKLKIDRGHPHTFTIPKIRRFLKKLGFDILYDEWEDYKACRAKDLESNSSKDRLKGRFGLSEFLFTSVSRKSI
jgi:ubiquinone/menaquinone biosynthesis C-methylase UbiE